MNAALITELISLGLTQWADYQDRQAKGTLTQDDIDAMLASLGHNLSSFQTLISSRPATNAAQSGA